ncbi:molecular chaperone HtpG, partial [Proteus terrae]
LWTRNKAEVSDEEYKEFYKHISHDFADPLSWVHNRVEGKQEYKAFWKEFGLVLKEGPAEDSSNIETIAKLLRFASTHNDSDAQTV